LVLDHESVISEIFLCASVVGCGTTTEDGLPPRKKRRKTRSTAALSTDRGNQSRKQDDNEDKGDKQTQGKGKGRKNLGKAQARHNKKVKARDKRVKKKSSVTNDGQRYTRMCLYFGKHVDLFPCVLHKCSQLVNICKFSTKQLMPVLIRAQA